MHKLTIYRITFTDTCDGELVDPDTEEVTMDCDPDEWDREEGKTAVDIAVSHLEDESITAPSQSPIPASGPLGSLWFSYVDGSYISNYYTGERTEVSAHPEGFTDDELRAVCTRIGAR